MPAESFAALYFVVLVGTLELVRRARLAPPDVTRKLFFAGIALFGLVSVLGWEGRAAVETFAVVAGLAYLSFLFELLHAIEDEGASLGSVYLPTAGALLFWWFGSERAYLAAAALVAAGFGDAAAGLIGRRMGTRRFRNLINARSMEGTLAMFLTCGLAMAPILAVLGPLGWHQAVAFSLIGATIAAVTEALSPYSLDNLTVPLASGLSLAALVRFSQ